MLYLWEIPEKTLNRDIGEYKRDISPNRLLLIAGRMLATNEFTPIPTVSFDIPQKKVLTFDCLPNNTQIPLVNHRIKDILEKTVPNEVQFFPAKILCKDGEIEGYSFLNITHLIKGIDHEKSIYKKMSMANVITIINYLTYKDGCMGEYHLARDEEYHGNLLASAKIKSIFEKELVTGVRFVRPEDFYSPITATDLINEYKRDSE